MSGGIRELDLVVANYTTSADELTTCDGIAALTLPAGYLGSSLIGALLVFAGFNIVASKVASLILGVCFILILWWAKRDWLCVYPVIYVYLWAIDPNFLLTSIRTIVTILASVGLLVGCWFIDHATPLRFFVLFIGVMSAMYSAWDIMDDLILRKVNESDASAFARRYGGSSKMWGVFWLLISLLFLSFGILVSDYARLPCPSPADPCIDSAQGGLAAFKESFAQQTIDSSHFLPT